MRVNPYTRASVLGNPIHHHSFIYYICFVNANFTTVFFRRKEINR